MGKEKIYIKYDNTILSSFILKGYDYNPKTKSYYYDKKIKLGNTEYNFRAIYGSYFYLERAENNQPTNVFKNYTKLVIMNSNHKYLSDKEKQQLLKEYIGDTNVKAFIKEYQQSSSKLYYLKYTMVYNVFSKEIKYLLMHIFLNYIAHIKLPLDIRNSKREIDEIDKNELDKFNKIYNFDVDDNGQLIFKYGTLCVYNRIKSLSNHMKDDILNYADMTKAFNKDNRSNQDEGQPVVLYGKLINNEEQHYNSLITSSFSDCYYCQISNYAKYLSYKPNERYLKEPMTIDYRENADYDNEIFKINDYALGVYRIATSYLYNDFERYNDVDEYTKETAKLLIEDKMRLSLDNTASVILENGRVSIVAEMNIGKNKGNIKNSELSEFWIMYVLEGNFTYKMDFSVRSKLRGIPIRLSECIKALFCSDNVSNNINNHFEFIDTINDPKYSGKSDKLFEFYIPPHMHFTKVYDPKDDKDGIKIYKSSIKF